MIKITIMTKRERKRKTKRRRKGRADTPLQGTWTR
jgi:hypothetical protein